jgi:hypothetical protein
VTSRSVALAAPNGKAVAAPKAAARKRNFMSVLPHCNVAGKT